MRMIAVDAVGDVDRATRANHTREGEHRPCRGYIIGYTLPSPFVPFPSIVIMSSPTRLRKLRVSNKSSGFQQTPTDARSSPEAPSPEKKRRLAEPYPIPSNNPASQYTLLEKLGTGSFGTVYKAIHNETKQIVAVKQIGTTRSFAALCLCRLTRM